MENYIVSARKYRPSTFDSVVGQKALTATLKNAIATQRLAHSYLFCGSRGVGKTSCARIFAKTINCEHPTPQGEACNECDSCRAFNEGNSMNIIELDAASNNGVDDIRQLVEQVQIPPSQGRYRVFIVDEVHMLSAAAFNAFLKTLEEPPSYVIFILATTEKHKIIPTILSRCQIYDFNRISIRDMIDHLAYVAKQEGISAEPPALNIIARKADGAMRDALSIFDQVAASSRGNITYKSAIENLNVLDYNYYNRLLDCFLEGKVLDTWMIYKEIRDRGFDSHFFINGLADYMRDLMVARDPSTIVLLEADDEARTAMAQTAVKCSPDFIYKAMNLCNEADLNYRTASNKQFLIELTLAKICQLLSPSPDNSGDGEGRLQKIKAATQAGSTNSTAVSQAQSPQAAARTAESVVHTAPVTTQTASTHTNATTGAAQAASRTVHAASGTAQPATLRPLTSGKHLKKVSTSTFSINNTASSVAAEAQNSYEAQTVAKRSQAYTQEQLNASWQQYIDTHPTEHILINTMRASFPAKISDHNYKVMVENEMQLNTMTQSTPTLMKYLHDTLGNDYIQITYEVNKGEASPHTWNERQVLHHMLENNPALRAFVDDLKLTIS